jgi:hypothetical protein
MKMKTGDVFSYRDPQISCRYGTGVVMTITPDEYVILWSARGLTRYRRSILDEKLEKVLQRVEKNRGLPKERHLQLGGPKGGVAFNENYDRERVGLLCEKLKAFGTRKAKDVADGLATELFTKKHNLQQAARAVLLQLAELCAARSSGRDEARDISRELCFGYVLRKSDFDRD